MSGKLREVQGSSLTSREQFLKDVVQPCEPVVLRSLVSAWPAVHAGTRSAPDFVKYLTRFDNGAQTEVFVGPAGIKGKYYYNEGLKGFNFERRKMRFGDALALLAVPRAEADGSTVYVGSVPVADCVPGFAAENVLPIMSAQVMPRIWLGHASNVSAHFDAVDNVACVVAGSRRFTLFPPAAISNLYVGPIDNTMAGQPVSLADAAGGDDHRYPRFREAEAQSLTGELGPGDAIYIPKLWWHRVESTAAFNVLVNYWWDAFAAGPDAPYTSLLLSMIAIAERPAVERQAWKAFFEHYVFRSEDRHPLEHLSPEQHGMLGPLKPDNYGKIRAIVMHRLRGG